MSCNTNTANKKPCQCPTRKPSSSSTCDGKTSHFGVEKNFSPVDCECFVTKVDEDVDVIGDLHVCEDLVVKGDIRSCGMIYANDICTMPDNLDLCAEECPPRSRRRALPKKRRVAKRALNSDAPRKFHTNPHYDSDDPSSDSQGSSSEDDRNKRVRCLDDTKVCGDLIVIRERNTHVGEKLKSLGQLQRWIELMGSEENAERDVMVQRVVEEDDDGGKANALIVLKRAIQKHSRDRTKFPSNNSMSQPVYDSGMAYLKQFGLTRVIDGNDQGIFLSSESAFSNLGELFDYIADE